MYKVKRFSQMTEEQKEFASNRQLAKLAKNATESVKKTGKLSDKVSDKLVKGKYSIDTITKAKPEINKLAEMNLKMNRNIGKYENAIEQVSRVQPRNKRSFGLFKDFMNKWN